MTRLDVTVECTVLVPGGAVRFHVPPNWPAQPSGWLPTREWRPPLDWPRPPLGWQFWSDDAGMPVVAPQGYFGDTPQRRSGPRRLVLAGAAFFLIGTGAGGYALLRPAPAAQRCSIKGDVTAGVRVFHRPSQASYASTRIDPAKGERWFCTETDARRAGWRPAPR